MLENETIVQNDKLIVDTFNKYFCNIVKKNLSIPKTPVLKINFQIYVLKASIEKYKDHPSIICFEDSNNPKLSFNFKSKRLKTKHIQSLWITKGIAKSSKRKQKLYEKFLKHRTPETGLTYKSYKNLFESLKKKGKKKYYSEKMSGCKSDAKKIWSIMKELIRKIKFKVACRVRVAYLKE